MRLAACRFEFNLSRACRRPVLQFSGPFWRCFAGSLAAQTPTTTVLSSSPNPSTFGREVTLSAKVSPVAASGSVTLLRWRLVPGRRYARFRDRHADDRFAAIGQPFPARLLPGRWYLCAQQFGNGEPDGERESAGRVRGPGRLFVRFGLLIVPLPLPTSMETGVRTSLR
jgi:hypothetical protein